MLPEKTGFLKNPLTLGLGLTGVFAAKTFSDAIQEVGTSSYEDIHLFLADARIKQYGIPGFSGSNGKYGHLRQLEAKIYSIYGQGKTPNPEDISQQLPFGYIVEFAAKWCKFGFGDDYKKLKGRRK